MPHIGELIPSVQRMAQTDSTTVVLASDFSSSSATSEPVTGLGFTPVPNRKYVVDVYLLLRTSLTSVGARPGVTWPSGCVDGVANVWATATAATIVSSHGNITGEVLTPVGTLPTTSSSWPGGGRATFVTGASPGGSFQVVLASSLLANSVTVAAGSWITWRVFS